MIAAIQRVRGDFLPGPHLGTANLSHFPTGKTSLDAVYTSEIPAFLPGNAIVTWMDNADFVPV